MQQALPVEWGRLLAVKVYYLQHLSSDKIKFNRNKFLPEHATLCAVAVIETIKTISKRANLQKT